MESKVSIARRNDTYRPADYLRGHPQNAPSSTPMVPILLFRITSAILVVIDRPDVIAGDVRILRRRAGDTAIVRTTDDAVRITRILSGDVEQ